MGNQQLCCNYKDKDVHGQDFSNEKPPGIEKASARSSRRAGTKNNLDKSQMDDLMKEAKKNEDKIVKMQANVRGFLSRKVNKKEDIKDPKPQLSNRSMNK